MIESSRRDKVTGWSAIVVFVTILGIIFFQHSPIDLFLAFILVKSSMVLGASLREGQLEYLQTHISDEGEA